MALQLRCPKCDNRVELGDLWAGKRVTCRCGEEVEIPSAEPAIKEGLPRPPTPHLEAAADRPAPRHYYEPEQDAESILPWILAGVAVVVVLLLLVGGMFWSLLRASPTESFHEDPEARPAFHEHPDDKVADPRPPEQPKEPQR